MALSLVLAGTGGAQAQERFFRYTDEQGGVVYSDRPPVSGEGTPVEVRRTHITDEQARKQAEALTERAEQRLRNRELQERERARIRQREIERARNCESARQASQSLGIAQRPQVEGEDGTLTVLDFEAKQKRLRELRDRMEAFCG